MYFSTNCINVRRMGHASKDSLFVPGANPGGSEPGLGAAGCEFGGGGFQDRFLEVKRSQLGPALGVNQQTVDQLLAMIRGISRCGTSWSRG